MVFGNYTTMWEKYGIKLISEVELTKEILDMVGPQSDLCDLVWAINAANQKDKSPIILSHTVMDVIHKLSSLLRSHRSFNNKSASDPERRAARHFTTDTVDRFRQRQPKIKKVFEDYIAIKSEERNHMQHGDAVSIATIPTEEYIKAIYREIAKLGDAVPENRLKEAVEEDFARQSRKLRADWWEITKTNLIQWSKKG